MRRSHCELQLSQNRIEKLNFMIVKQTGTSQQFIGSLSNGINSTSFSTIFPSSFQFSSATSSNCKDLHTEILIFNVFMLFILVFILRPPPLYMFWAMVVCGFWHEGLVSQTKGKLISFVYHKVICHLL